MNCCSREVLYILNYVKKIFMSTIKMGGLHDSMTLMSVVVAARFRGLVGEARYTSIIRMKDVYLNIHNNPLSLFKLLACMYIQTSN